MTGDVLFRKENVNLNTIIAIIGFLGMFAGLTATWTSIQYRQASTDKWQTEHMEMHAKISSDAAARYAGVTARLDEYQKQFVALEEFKYKVVALDKTTEAAETRTSRIVDSYSQQFTEIRTQLATLNTSIALANDALGRLEKVDTRNLTGTNNSKTGSGFAVTTPNELQ